MNETQTQSLTSISSTPATVLAAAPSATSTVRFKKKTDPELEQYIEQLNIMLTENMGEFNLKTLIRLISFIKQCIYSHQLRVSDIASEWAPLLFRNPQITSDAIDRVKQMDALLNAGSPRAEEPKDRDDESNKQKAKHNPNQLHSNNLHGTGRWGHEDDVKREVEWSAEKSVQSTSTTNDGRKETTDSDRMLCDLMIFLLSNDISLLDNSYIKGAHTLAEIVQHKQ
ncbi:hypothetical protein RFI_25932 [Reticulomyxa filosa]|uniref:Uncharacterized protein n=1 Tax=Reticulomyxa filosa TaxID=46433 RepID=X6MBR6_RETFI|nr:hypothetical protein RFI_25932 [Reticulomyxa filosa]|eukprot:ETO11443.1 hypothetical protein RFI_25932 [Reticulomyxa filosa]